MSLYLSSCSNVPVKWEDLNPVQFAQNFTAVQQHLKVTGLFLDRVRSHIITIVHQIIHGIGCGGRRHCCGLFFLLPLRKPWTINPAKLHISALYRFTKQNTTQSLYCASVPLPLLYTLKEKKSFRTCACILQVVQTSCFRPTEPLLIRNDLSPIQFVQNSTAVITTTKYTFKEA